MEKQLEKIYDALKNVEPEAIHAQATKENDPDKKAFLYDLYDLRLAETQRKIIAEKKFVI